MAVLLVNQHTVPIFIDIANAFAEAGEETILFTGHVETGGKPLSTKIKIVKSISYQRHSVVSRLLTWLIFSIHYFFYLLVTQRLTRILVVTNPPLAPLITGLIAGWRKLPYFILIYDLYPEAFVQARFLNSSHLLYRSWQDMNIRYFKTAKGIFTLSESMKKAASAYVDDSTKISVVHNWVDTDYMYPISKTENAFISNNGLGGKTVVMYAGNMGLTHDLESVVGAAELLKELKKVVFVFIGEGGKLSLLQRQVKDKKLSNVVFLPYQPAAYFPMAMAAADIGIVTLGVGTEGISVPSKTYINLAAGSCILAIAPADSELTRLITEYHAGIVCNPGNPSSLAQAVTELLSDNDLLTRYKENALKASKVFTSKNAKKYIRVVLGPT